MAVKESAGRKVFNALNIAVMVLLIIITAYPMFYVVIASLSDSNELMRSTDILLKPLGFNINAYKAVAEEIIERLNKGKQEKDNQ